ncbi:MAG: SH3 domain-containing protein [Coriobacteriales bacterium]|nr:SH3 domain-containing protein [Coriobacteriales bacterium]
MIEMNRTMRALLGLAIIVVLFFVVLGFWGQYRSARDSAARSEEATIQPSKVEGAAAKSDSKSKASSKKAEEPKKGDKVVRVLIQGLNFRESPAPDANPIRGLDDGDTLLFISKEGNWFKVEDGQGVEGWVSANDQYTKLETVK